MSFERVTIGDAVLYCGDNRAVLATMADDSLDACVTDPPYELGFMGRDWDRQGIANDPEFWAAVLRVLKPGAHLLAFGGTRTHHRMMCAIEDAGFEIRDCVMWVYGQGFPKSLDVSKAIDKAAGAEREVVGTRGKSGFLGGVAYAQDEWTLAQAGRNLDLPVTAHATDAARQWQGWGTALKPAWEPIIVARKPLAGTVAENVLAHGTGAINIDGCRVEHVTVDGGSLAVNTHLRSAVRGGAHVNVTSFTLGERESIPHAAGRWPANVIHDGSEEVLALLPQTTSGEWKGQVVERSSDRTYNGGWGPHPIVRDKDIGSAARFFYCAKASKRDRDEGLDAQPARRGSSETFDASNRDGTGAARMPMRRNHHPTVKPTDLMRYLCRLVTPPGGTVLDPFAGSGSTGKAAGMEGFAPVLIERDAEYFEIAKARVAWVQRQPKLDIEPSRQGVLIPHEAPTQPQQMELAA